MPVMTQPVQPAPDVVRGRADARRSLVGYLLLAFAITWAAWTPAALHERGVLEVPFPVLVLTIIGGFGPMIAAMVMAGRRDGRAGVRRLFRQLRLHGLQRRWLVIALAVGLLDLTPLVVHLAAGRPLEGDVVGQLLVVPLQFLFVAVAGGGLDEEMGWRGYAQPLHQRLAAPLPATVTLGVIWTLWHVPLFFDPTSSHATTNFGVYLVTTVAQAVVIGFLYNASGGSLLVAVFAHSAANTADGLRLAVIGDSQATADLVQLVAYVAGAVAVTAITRGRLGLPQLDGQRAHARPSARGAVAP